MLRFATGVVLVGLAASASGCGSKAAAPAAACDQTCIDGVALRSLRTMLKLAFNLALQGADAGPDDATTACPNGGTAHVHGAVTVNAAQGAIEVDLTYDFADCEYAVKDDKPETTFHLKLNGSLTEKGTLAQQPTATTALLFASRDLTLVGTVFDPPVTYAAASCALKATQDGNAVSGVLCGRPGSYSF